MFVHIVEDRKLKMSLDPPVSTLYVNVFLISKINKKKLKIILISNFKWKEPFPGSGGKLIMLDGDEKKMRIAKCSICKNPPIK